MLHLRFHVFFLLIKKFVICLSLLVLFAPFVSALTILAPTNVTSGGFFTINWTSAAGDPATWTFELTNPSFNNAIAISNNVDPSLGSITIQCPVVTPGGAFTIQAVDIGNINMVFAESPIFSIGATITSSSSGATVSTTASATASSQTGVAT
ncbi:hypothetical protein BYT27DRAFT_7119137 [Phlegmacium glaucopus]|nr:hypothetical protein BYT27DRAFT_7119137 [Phlegmacium glaucopus]